MKKYCRGEGRKMQPKNWPRDTIGIAPARRRIFRVKSTAPELFSLPIILSLVFGNVCPVRVASGGDYFRKSVAYKFSIDKKTSTQYT
jgi:hypothetical protein